MAAKSAALSTAHGVPLTTIKECLQFLQWLNDRKREKNKVATAFVQKLRSYYQFKQSIKGPLQFQYAKFLTNVSMLYETLSAEVTRRATYEVATRDAKHILEALLECTPKLLAALSFIQYHVDDAFNKVGGGEWASLQLKNGELGNFLTSRNNILEGGFAAEELSNVQGSALAKDLRKILNKEYDARGNPVHDHFRNVILTTLGGSLDAVNTGNAVFLLLLFCQLVIEDPKGNKYKSHMEEGIKPNTICWQDLESHCKVLNKFIAALRSAGFSATGRAFKPNEDVKFATNAANWFRENLAKAAGELRKMIPQSIHSMTELQTFAKDHLYPNGFIFDGSNDAAWPKPPNLQDWNPIFQKFRQLDGLLGGLKEILDGKNIVACQPIATKTDAAKPVVTKAEAAKPTATKTEATKTVAAKPAAPEAKGTSNQTKSQSGGNAQGSPGKNPAAASSPGAKGSPGSEGPQSENGKQGTTTTKSATSSGRNTVPPQQPPPPPPPPPLPPATPPRAPAVPGPNGSPSGGGGSQNGGGDQGQKAGVTSQPGQSQSPSVNASGPGSPGVTSTGGGKGLPGADSKDGKGQDPKGGVTTVKQSTGSSSTKQSPGPPSSVAPAPGNGPSTGDQVSTSSTTQPSGPGASQNSTVAVTTASSSTGAGLGGGGANGVGGGNIGERRPGDSRDPFDKCTSSHGLTKLKLWKDGGTYCVRQADYTRQDEPNKQKHQILKGPQQDAEERQILDVESQREKLLKDVEKRRRLDAEKWLTEQHYFISQHPIVPVNGAYHYQRPHYYRIPDIESSAVSSYADQGGPMLNGITQHDATPPIHDLTEMVRNHQDSWDKYYDEERLHKTDMQRNAYKELEMFQHNADAKLVAAEGIRKQQWEFEKQLKNDSNIQGRHIPDETVKFRPPLSVTVEDDITSVLSSMADVGGAEILYRNEGRHLPPLPPPLKSTANPPQHTELPFPISLKHDDALKITGITGSSIKYTPEKIPKVEVPVNLRVSHSFMPQFTGEKMSNPQQLSPTSPIAISKSIGPRHDSTKSPITVTLDDHDMASLTDITAKVIESFPKSILNVDVPDDDRVIDTLMPEILVPTPRVNRSSEEFLTPPIDLLPNKPPAVDFVEPASPDNTYPGLPSETSEADILSHPSSDVSANWDEPKFYAKDFFPDPTVCVNPWYVPATSYSFTSSPLPPPPDSDHLRPPTDVRAMLFWLVGLNTYGLIAKIERHMEGMLMILNGDTFYPKYALQVNGDLSSLSASHIADTLTEACLYSAHVLNGIMRMKSKDALSPIDFKSEYGKFRYSSDPGGLLCQLRDYTYACHHQLEFLKAQCNRDKSHGGWKHDKYGSDITSPNSPLQSFLTDDWDSTFETHFFDPCNLCHKSRVRMGFSDKDFPEKSQTGSVISTILTPSCGGEDPLLTLSSYLNLLTRRTPRTTGELVSFFHNLGNSLHDMYLDTLLPLGSALSEPHPDCPDWDHLGRHDLQAVKGIRGSEALNSISNHKHDNAHPRTLSTLVGCGSDPATCHPHCSPITYRAYALYSQSFAHTYLSWAVYLPDRLWESLEKLFYELKKHDYAKCSSLYLCSTALPLLYTHGFTPPEGTSQVSVTCQQVIFKLHEIVNGGPIASLMTAMDDFLYRVREPFIFTLVTLWSTAFLIFANTMLYRLDVLYIRSHLLRSKASHRIDVKALLTKGRKMLSLYKDVDYFDEGPIGQLVIQ